MIITDRARAKACLSRVGYYRLSAYWYPFRSSRSEIRANGAQEVFVDDLFRPGTTFTTIMDLYVFDKKLRLLVMDGLERIEIALRTDIALLLGRQGSWAHRDKNVLHGNFARRPNKYSATGKTKHLEWLERLDDKFSRSKEDFAKHFKSRYPGDHLPIWSAVELWDFGHLSHFYAGMTVDDRDTIAQQYGVATGTVFESWLRCLNDVRNICAHHSRLWNKPLVAQPRLPQLGEIDDLDHLSGTTHSQTRLYAVIMIMKVMLKIVNPSSTWAARIRSHVKSLPPSDVVTLLSAGFPAGWEALPPWDRRGQ